MAPDCLQWRLIPLLAASGTIQMAIDRWLLQQHRQGKHPPTLRFYTWSPPAISLGYHQRRYPPDWHQLQWQGTPLDIVRRPSGGRAVLHQGDLTYMAVTSGLPGSRVEVYQRICQFLIDGWQALGVELHYGSAGGGYIRQPNCFATATPADLVDRQGHKFIGSAQLRQGNAILQHGSMGLFPDPSLWTRVFPGTAPPQRREERVREAVTALTAAASQCFGVELVRQPLSEREWEAIRTLAAHPDIKFHLPDSNG